MKRTGQNRRQRALHPVLTVSAVHLALVQLVGWGEAEGQAELFRAGLEQGGLVAAAGNAAVMLTVLHRGTHDLLDERDLTEHLLDRHRGG